MCTKRCHIKVQFECRSKIKFLESLFQHMTHEVQSTPPRTITESKDIHNCPEYKTWLAASQKDIFQYSNFFVAFYSLSRRLVHMCPYIAAAEQIKHGRRHLERTRGWWLRCPELPRGAEDRDQLLSLSPCPSSSSSTSISSFSSSSSCSGCSFCSPSPPLPVDQNWEILYFSRWKVVMNPARFFYEPLFPVHHYFCLWRIGAGPWTEH